MNRQNIQNIIKLQNDYFLSGKTLSIEFRRNQLIKLLKALAEYEEKIIQALRDDLSKPEMEAYISELGFLKTEINFALKNMNKWTRPKTVPTPLFSRPGKSQIYYEPYGTVLIISPWNYPINLTLSPLIGALTAGNTVVIKPSEVSQASSAILEEMIKNTFEPGYVSLVQGGRTVSQLLLSEKFDYIFYTGSSEVGKIVMKAAAENLTPVTLELGGKSPAIIDREVNLKRSVPRIVAGKFYNTGQTCVAPDYLLVPEEMKEKVIAEISEVIKKFYGTDPLRSPDLGRIVNKNHFIRLKNLIGNRARVGGKYDEAALRIEPTVLDDIQWEDPVMQAEIFGPILPILTYNDLDELLVRINQLPHSLALYFFSENSHNQEKVLRMTSSGGTCINDAMIHLANIHLPFGGFGNSGLGSYHGKFSFETFSHRRSVLKRSTFSETLLRYPPYKKTTLNLVKKMLKWIS